jgi:replicative DNA helicase
MPTQPTGQRQRDPQPKTIGKILEQEIAAGRIPPQNIEAETSLLGSILIEKDAIIKIADMVTAEDFYVDRNGLIYAGILDLYEQRQPIDIISLSGKLRDAGQLELIGGSTYITELTMAVPSAAHVVHYAGIVSHKATLRRIIAAASRISTFGYDEQTPLENLLDKAEQTIFEVSQKNLKENFIPISEVLTESFERLNDLHATTGKLRGTSTGFRDLDNMLAGLQNSDLIILAARPSMGKTTFVMNVAHHVAAKEGIPVGFFSLEVSKEQLIDQLLAIESGVDSWKLRTGALDDDDFPRLNEAMAELSEAPLYIDDSAMTNVMEMRTKARRLQAEHGLGLIIIDYLQLISGGSRSDGRQQEVSEISRGLKGLARELDVPVIALSQLSRAVESRTPPVPQLADLRDSGCLTGDTRVYLPEKGEYAPIKSLVGKSGIAVSSVNTDTWKIETALMTKAFSTGVKPVFRMTTSSGRTIRATANHKFLTSSGWKRLDELSIGERIATPDANRQVRPQQVWQAHVVPAMKSIGMTGRGLSVALGYTYNGMALYNNYLAPERPNKAAQLVASNDLWTISRSDVCWDKIKSVVPDGVEEVFDLTVPGPHNFVASDIIVHNSIEQDADVVMFIYREAYYNKQTERDNITDILIKKHRNGPVGDIELYFHPEQRRFTNLDRFHG